MPRTIALTAFLSPFSSLVGLRILPSNVEPYAAPARIAVAPWTPPAARYRSALPLRFCGIVQAGHPDTVGAAQEAQQTPDVSACAAPSSARPIVRAPARARRAGAPDAARSPRPIGALNAARRA